MLVAGLGSIVPYVCPYPFEFAGNYPDSNPNS